MNPWTIYLSVMPAAFLVGMFAVRAAMRRDGACCDTADQLFAVFGGLVAAWAWPALVVLLAVVGLVYLARARVQSMLAAGDRLVDRLFPPRQENPR